MPKVRNLLGRGNAKLGEGIFQFSLPPVLSCPGATELCKSVCYARRGRFRTGKLELIHTANLMAATDKSFVRRITKEIRRRGVGLVRIHVAGDFFSPEYVAKWVRIAELSRRTQFFCYTRSWREPDIAVALEELAEQDNVSLWFSTDRETGLPSHVPSAALVAYLQTEADEQPFEEAELVFRTKRLRDQKPTTFPMRVICSNERPDARSTTCTQCRRCIDTE